MRTAHGTDHRTARETRLAVVTTILSLSFVAVILSGAGPKEKPPTPHLSTHLSVQYGEDSRQNVNKTCTASPLQSHRNVGGHDVALTGQNPREGEAHAS